MERKLKKVILADDDKDILTVAQYSLETMPELEVKYCNSGEDAIQEALIFLPDLFVLDMMMPKMDGLETMKAIRLLPKLSNIPVIFLTAKIQINEVENYLKMGAIAVIPKPFDPMVLGKDIQICWENSFDRKNKFTEMELLK